MRMLNFSHILNAGFDTKNELLEDICRCSLLVIDDFGSERESEYGLETIHSVLDARYNCGKPMIVTTNLPLQTINHPTDVMHKKIYDRLKNCVPIQFTGESFRKDIGFVRHNRETYSTIHTIRGVLRPAFQLAVDDDVLVKNPFEFKLINVLVNDSITREALSKEQMNKLLKFIRDDNVYWKYYDVVYILFHTGMRISEFCGLTLQDIDLKNNIVNIDHQLMRDTSSKKYIQSTKTNAGTRKLLIKDDVAECFRQIIADRPKVEFEKMIDGHEGFLCIDEKGEPLVAMHWEHRFNHMVGRYNSIFKVQMQNTTPHICRHTYCTNQAKAGMSPKTLQYLMGHSEIGVTLNTYTHLGLEDAAEEMKRMQKLEEARREMYGEEKEKPMKQNMFKVV